MAMDMFESAKRTMDELKEGIKDKIDVTKLELAYGKKKKKLEQEQMEVEQNEKAQEILRAEHERLSALDEKELMVEMVFAIRGFYSEMESLKANRAELAKRMESLENDLGRIQKDIDLMKEKNNG